MVGIEDTHVLTGLSSIDLLVVEDGKGKLQSFRYSQMMVQAKDRKMEEEEEGKRRGG